MSKPIQACPLTIRRRNAKSLCLFAEAKGKEYTALPTLNQTVTSEQETRFSTKPPPDGQWTNARKT